MKRIVCLTALLVAGPALAQESPSYKITSATFNAGGRPAAGVVAESASFRLSLDAIGEAAVGSGLAGPDFAMDGGLVASFPPPGESKNLRFTDSVTLVWDSEPSTGDYALYQGTIGLPFDAGYGACAQPPPTLTLPTATVAALPAEGRIVFYLVTARNRLSEEGTKGFTSRGSERPNPYPCP